MIIDFESSDPASSRLPIMNKVRNVGTGYGRLAHAFSILFYTFMDHAGSATSPNSTTTTGTMQAWKVIVIDDPQVR